MFRNSLFGVVFALLPFACVAGELPAPTEDVVLTISGAIENHNGDGSAQLDRTMLAAMRVIELETTTVWQEGTQRFTGVPLKDILALVGSDAASSVAAIALNDYQVTIPVASIEDDVPIVAFLMNGEPMSPRDKGPLWIVYPYDSDEKYRNEVTYSRSIWQLDRLNLTR